MLLFDNTEQFEGILQQVGLVIAIVLGESLCPKAVEARSASVVLRA